MLVMLLVEAKATKNWKNREQTDLPSIRVPHFTYVKNVPTVETVLGVYVPDAKICVQLDRWTNSITTW